MTVIYSLWLQGYKNAPEQVKICLDRWRNLNSTYTFCLLEASDVKTLVSKYPLKIDNVTPQSLSDIVRLILLHQTGGIWVDATVFPTKPLSAWFEETVGKADFFSYQREIYQTQPKDRPISAWFLYAKNNSEIIKKLWEESLRYWSVERRPIIDLEKDVYRENPIKFMGLGQEISNTPYPYHWFQHIFTYLTKTDPVFAKVWNSCPYKSMTNPHQMQYWFREDLFNKDMIGCLTEEKIRFIVENSVMQKLDWRMKFPIEIMEKYSVNISRTIAI